MKKSQILAALALAFALGVVIPVSGAVNAASTEWSINADDPSKGTANDADVTAAINYAKANPDYQNILKLQEELKKLQGNTYPANTTVGVATLDNVENGKYYEMSGISTYLMTDALKTDITAIDATNAAVTKIGAIKAANVIKISDLKAMIEAAKTVPNYEEYAAVVVAYEAKNPNTLRTELDRLNSALKLTTTKIDTSLAKVESYINNANLAGFVDAAAGTTGLATQFANYKTLVDDVVEFSARVASYEAGYDAILTVAKALYFNNQLTATGVNGYTVTVDQPVTELRNAKALDAKAGAAANVYYVDGTNAQAFYAGTGAVINNLALWDRVTAVIDTMGNLSAYPNSIKYDRIYKLADAYRAATYPEFSKYDIEEVAQIMVDYKAQTKPNGPVDGDEGDNQGQGTDDGTDTTAPNTGALLNSDNGATTVSVVAGLATALTALGAGVVAYRNARRSSRK